MQEILRCDKDFEKRSKKCTEPGLIARGLFAEAIGEFVPPEIEVTHPSYLHCCRQSYQCNVSVPAYADEVGDCGILMIYRNYDMKKSSPSWDRMSQRKTSVRRDQ